MKNYLTALYLIFAVSCSSIDQKSVISPDSSIKLNFQVSNGVPFYSVKKNNKVIVEESLLGIILKNNLDFSSGLKIDNISSSSHSSQWTPQFGEQSIIENTYNELSVSLTKDDLKMKIFFRVFDDGVADRKSVV